MEADILFFLHENSILNQGTSHINVVMETGCKEKRKKETCKEKGFLPQRRTRMNGCEME